MNWQVHRARLLLVHVKISVPFLRGMRICAGVHGFLLFCQGKWVEKWHTG